MLIMSSYAALWISGDPDTAQPNIRTTALYSKLKCRAVARGMCEEQLCTVYNT